MAPVAHTNGEFVNAEKRAAVAAFSSGLRSTPPAGGPVVCLDATSRFAKRVLPRPLLQNDVA